MNYKQKETISVALCTLNGEKHLQDQLLSLEKQSLHPDELVICDDASTDATVDIIERFRLTSNLNIRLIQNKATLGVIENFSKAISLCSAKYIALCDQDDIWLPDKLENGLEAMIKAEKTMGENTPLLFHSDATIIDHNGRITSPSFMKMRKIEHIDSEPLPILLVQNFVTGNTVIINRPLADLALPIPRTAMMHDWWLALLAAACGRILFTNNATVLYRQHKNNLIGAVNLLSQKNLYRLASISRLEKELALSLGQAELLLHRLKNENCIHYSSFLEKYLDSFNKGGFGAIYLAHKTRVRKAGQFRTLGLYMLLLKKGYLKYLNR